MRVCPELTRVDSGGFRSGASPSNQRLRPDVTCIVGAWRKQAPTTSSAAARRARRYFAAIVITSSMLVYGALIVSVTEPVGPTFGTFQL